MEENKQNIATPSQAVSQPSIQPDVKGPVSEKPNKKSASPLWVIIIVLVILVVGVIGWVYTKGNKATQQQSKVYHIGVLVGAAIFDPIAVSFKKDMATLGYKEGVNVVYDVHSYDNDPASEKMAIQKFVQDKVDLIFTLPTRPTEEAKAATKGTNIPIVFGAAGIEGTDLIKSVGQPGDNLTGIRIYSPDNTVKRLELLHEIDPNAKRINLIYSNYETVPSNLEALHAAAPKINVTLIQTPVKSIAEAKAYLDKLGTSKDLGIDAILVLPEALMTSPDALKVLGDFSAKYKIPVSTTVEAPNSDNILFGYNLNFDELGLDSAKLADQILKGTQAGTIPVVSPNAELWINYKVAKALGLTISESILSSAKHVVR